MIVYRIEHPSDRCGPYTRQSEGNSANLDRLFADHELLDRTPLPWCDGIEPPFPEDHRYGFISLHQLMMWFSEEELQAMSDDGYVVAKYEVIDPEDFACGYRQIMYNPETAMCLRRAICKPNEVEKFVENL